MIDRLHNSFNKVEFEPINHRYMVAGKILQPVSTVIKRYYDEFDTDSEAVRYSERHGGNPFDIAKEWREIGEEASELGKNVHRFAERYFYDKNIRPSNEYEEAVARFWRLLPSHIIKLSSELIVYSERLQFAGTIDNLFFDGINGGVIISDYKTTKDLFNNYKGKKMNAPFDFLYDMPLSKYELQLSMYQIPLQELGIKVIDRWIVWLKPDGMFELFHGNDYSRQIEMNLNNAA